MGHAVPDKPRPLGTTWQTYEASETPDEKAAKIPTLMVWDLRGASGLISAAPPRKSATLATLMKVQKSCHFSLECHIRLPLR
jgi:hypothetical protein